MDLLDKYKDNPKVTPYLTHGFEIQGESGNQIYGNCLLCGNEEKFYLNPATGQYDCKVCSVSGNVYNFLQALIEERSAATTKLQFKRLEKLRGLPVEAYKYWDMAWDDLTQRWLIPCVSEKGTVRDIRYWTLPKGKKKGMMRSTKGCKTQLFGIDRLVQLDRGATVWICEGEWDAAALAWILESQDAGEDNWAVVAVPGAGVMKDDWLPFLKGHDVIFAYDHDDAGRKGRERAGRMLKGIARKLQTLDWGDELPDGYDVRDFVLSQIDHQTPDEIAADLQGIVADFEPPDERGVERVVVGQESISMVAVGSVDPADIPTFPEVLDVFRAKIEMMPEMEDGLKLCLAIALSNQIPGDQLWIYFVGPPGCGKTLLLKSLRGSERCHFNSSLTPHSLVSGFRSEQDPSLLPQWNGRCAVLKDFTEVLASHPQAKDELFGTLRGAYDGHVRRVFGNGIVREYCPLRFSMLAGVTPAIHGDRQAMMGERFLKYEIMKGKDWNADQEIMAAINSISHEDDVDAALADIVGRFLSREIDPSMLPAVPEWVKTRVVALAQLIAALRANVERELYGEQRLKYRPVREVGTRLAKQIVKLGQMVALVDGEPEIDQGTYALMERVAFDTAVGFHLEVVGALMEVDGHSTRKDLSERLGLPETTLGRSLEDLHALGIVERKKAAMDSRGRPSVDWIVAPFVKDLWERAQIGR